MKNDDLKKIIRELVDEVLNEMTTSGAAGSYLTPNAFRGHKSKKETAEKSMPGGKVVGKEDTDDTTVGENDTMIIRRGDILEGRGRYNNFKGSDMMKTHAKISYGVGEAKKMLREVEFLVSICERLKLESGTGSDQLWKKTKPDILAIHGHLKKIAARIKKIGN